MILVQCWISYRKLGEIPRQQRPFLNGSWSMMTYQTSFTPISFGAMEESFENFRSPQCGARPSYLDGPLQQPHCTVALNDPTTRTASRIKDELKNSWLCTPVFRIFSSIPVPLFPPTSEDRTRPVPTWHGSTPSKWPSEVQTATDLIRPLFN